MSHQVIFQHGAKSAFDSRHVQGITIQFSSCIIYKAFVLWSELFAYRLSEKLTKSFVTSYGMSIKL